MAAKGFKLTPASEKEVRDHLKKVERVFASALVFRLEALVAELVNHAKINGEYNDITSNLRSSIGGVVLRNGKPVSYTGFIQEKTADTGHKDGKSFINTLIPHYQRGYVLLVVAGMEYASYVEDGGEENRTAKNVLKLTDLEMQRQLPIIMKKLKLQIDKV